MKFRRIGVNTVGLRRKESLMTVGRGNEHVRDNTTTTTKNEYE